MTRVKITKKRQITIPKRIFEKFGLNIGDYLEAKAEKDKIIYIPKKEPVAKDTWYWSKECQEAIKESFKAEKEGRVIGPFKTAKEAMEALKKYARKYGSKNN